MDRTDRIMDHGRFAETFCRLAGVSLNPRRHTAANALEHSEAVAARAAALARANGCTEREACLLEDLGRAHDIGKVTGTARPERSLEVLRECGIEDPALLALVKWHDTSLPWYLAQERGQPPSDKAWRRLAADVDLRLLAIFMVADRVDAPPGWRRNAPTAWFLGEARRRGLIEGLVLDLAEHPSEISAGGVLVRQGGGSGAGGASGGGGAGDGREVLVIRVRAEGYELPKGGIEWDELPEDAAVRETVEEAGVASPLRAGAELASLDYFVGEGADRHRKRVRYFAFTAMSSGDEGGDVAGAGIGTGVGVGITIELGPLPERTRERRWIGPEEASTIPLVNEELRPILLQTLRGAG
jgi:ADP-ribose pyrophosphatase YjhB (NUDIX family)